MITLTNLEKIYRTKEIETVALENVNLTVNKGEFLSIMGPSGCGKSTLLNIIGLLDAPTSGTVEIAGINTINMNDKQLAEFRNQKLGFVFQSFHLINSLNVLDNVELPLLYRKVSAKERREAAVAVLEKVGLSHRMRHFPTQLSGGQCQRVAIARAIVNNPKILLADEPTGALDTKSGEQIMEIFQRLNEEGVTIVMITHEPEIAAHARRVLHIRDGQLLETQAPKEESPTLPGDLIPPKEFSAAREKDPSLERAATSSRQRAGAPRHGAGKNGPTPRPSRPVESLEPRPSKARHGMEERRFKTDPPVDRSQGAAVLAEIQTSLREEPVRPSRPVSPAPPPTPVSAKSADRPRTGGFGTPIHTDLSGVFQLKETKPKQEQPTRKRRPRKPAWGLST